jgi:hypothetical protein
LCQRVSSASRPTVVMVIAASGRRCCDLQTEVGPIANGKRSVSFEIEFDPLTASQ